MLEMLHRVKQSKGIVSRSVGYGWAAYAWKTINRIYKVLLCNYMNISENINNVFVVDFARRYLLYYTP